MVKPSQQYDTVLCVVLRCIRVPLCESFNATCIVAWYDAMHIVNYIMM